MTSETAEYVAESHVTPKKIRELFTRAFYGTHLDEDGDILVNAEPISVYVSINEDDKLLRYAAYYRIDGTAPLEAKHAFVNRMNDAVVFCRFSIPENDQDTLVADYYLPFGEHVNAFQIVSSFRLFARIVPNAIRDCDDSDLIK